MKVLVQAVLMTTVFITCECTAKTNVDVQQLGNGFLKVQAEATIPASLAMTWDILTDYEHLAGFIPEMASSHIISATGETSQVEQKGGTSFLSFSFPIEVVFEIEAIPYRHISFHSIKGNLRDMTGSYTLEQIASTTHLYYETKFHPDFWLPPLINTSIIRIEIEHQFEGLIKEIERREAINTGRPINDAHDSW